MGHQIIKQPNGLFCVFSSVVDHVILYDATSEDIIEERVKEATENIRKGVLATCAELDAGKKPYHQFTMTCKEMVRTIKSHHGKDDETLADLLKCANAPQGAEHGDE